MLIIITTMSVASARMACDEDAARALRRPWAPVVFHGERETESLGKFSLPRVARFPSTSELVRALRRSGGSLWIENAGTAGGPSRVKILGVVSADCQ